MQQQFGQEQAPKEKIDSLNFELNYHLNQFEYDYDPEDRPCVYPEQSYAKHIYPINNSYTNLYGSEQSAGGQAYDAEWNSVACTNFLG